MVPYQDKISGIINPIIPIFALFATGAILISTGLSHTPSKGSVLQANIENPSCNFATNGWLQNPPEKVASSNWFKLHKYGDCPTDNNGTWENLQPDCYVADQGGGPVGIDKTIVQDPLNLYYKHFTPADALSLITPFLQSQDLSTQQNDSLKEQIRRAINALIRANPRRAASLSFDSVYLGLKNGKNGNPVESSTILVHPIVERPISQAVGVNERVRLLYQPFLQAATGENIPLSDAVALYEAALNRCGGDAVGGDQSGRGTYKIFGDYIAVVQFWSDSSQDGLFSSVADCNIHVVKRPVCRQSNPTTTPDPSQTQPTPTDLHSATPTLVNTATPMPDNNQTSIEGKVEVYTCRNIDDLWIYRCHKGGERGNSDQCTPIKLSETGSQGDNRIFKTQERGSGNKEVYNYRLTTDGENKPIERGAEYFFPKAVARVYPPDSADQSHFSENDEKVRILNNPTIKDFTIFVEGYQNCGGGPTPTLPSLPGCYQPCRNQTPQCAPGLICAVYEGVPKCLDVGGCERTNSCLCPVTTPDISVSPSPFVPTLTPMPGTCSYLAKSFVRKCGDDACTYQNSVPITEWDGNTAYGTANDEQRFAGPNPVRPAVWGQTIGNPVAENLRAGPGEMVYYTNEFSLSEYYKRRNSRANVKLYFPGNVPGDPEASRWEIVSRYCNPASTDCPPEGIQSTYPSDTIGDFKMVCNMNVEYGWLLRDKGKSDSCVLNKDSCAPQNVTVTGLKSSSKPQERGVRLSWSAPSSCPEFDAEKAKYWIIIRDDKNNIVITQEASKAPKTPEIDDDNLEDDGILVEKQIQYFEKGATYRAQVCTHTDASCIKCGSTTFVGEGPGDWDEDGGGGGGGGDDQDNSTGDSAGRGSICGHDRSGVCSGSYPQLKEDGMSMCERAGYGRSYIGWCDNTGYTNACCRPGDSGQQIPPDQPPPQQPPPQQPPSQPTTCTQNGSEQKLESYRECTGCPQGQSRGIERYRNNDGSCAYRVADRCRNDRACGGTDVPPTLPSLTRPTTIAQRPSTPPAQQPTTPPSQAPVQTPIPNQTWHTIQSGGPIDIIFFGNGFANQQDFINSARKAVDQFNETNISQHHKGLFNFVAYVSNVNCPGGSCSQECRDFTSSNKILYGDSSAKKISVEITTENLINIGYGKAWDDHMCISKFGIDRTDRPQWILAHEMGHSIFKLSDEYTTNYSASDAPTWPNCSTQGCNKWSQITDTCIKGCFAQNWYRPSNVSIMNTNINGGPRRVQGSGRTPQFNEVSLAQIDKIFDNNRLQSNLLNQFQTNKLQPENKLSLKISLNQFEKDKIKIKEIELLPIYPHLYFKHDQKDFYTVEIRQDQQTLYTTNINIDETEYRESQPPITTLKKTLELYLPYFPDSETVHFSNEKGKEILQIDLSQYKLIKPKIVEICGDGVCNADFGETIQSCRVDCVPGESVIDKLLLKTSADLNEDGVVNSLDYTIMNKRKADLNDDGQINALDYSLILDNFGKEVKF